MLLLLLTMMIIIIKFRPLTIFPTKQLRKHAVAQLVDKLRYKSWDRLSL